MKLLRGRLGQAVIIAMVSACMGGSVWAQDASQTVALKNVKTQTTTSPAVDEPQPCGEAVAEDLTGLSEKEIKIKQTLPITNPLWIAGNFNFFIFDTHEMTDGDSQGRVAVGKKAVYKRYAIAPYVDQSQEPYPVAMVLGKGGTLSLTDTEVNGNIITDKKENVKFQGTKTPQIDEIDVSKNLIDFDTLRAKYMTLSYFLALKIPNGIVKVNPYDPNAIELIAPDNPGSRVIFNLPKNITRLSEIKISISNIDLEQRPTIIINSFGNAVGQTAQMFINGSSELVRSYASNIIWNLPFAYPGVDIPIAGTIYGSVLAPTGDFKVTGWGNVEGTFIANKFVSEGNFEGHKKPFEGKIPPVTCPNIEELEYWTQINK